MRGAAYTLISVALLVGAGASSAACDQSCERGADSRLKQMDDDSDALMLVGLTRDEVVARFGPPSSERFSPEWDSTYWIRSQGFCMDGWYLVVDFDEQQMVVRAKVLPG